MNRDEREIDELRTQLNRLRIAADNIERLINVVQEDREENANVEDMKLFSSKIQSFGWILQ